MVITITTTAQNTRKDKAEFKEHKNLFYEEIQKNAKLFSEDKPKPEKRFMMDYTGIDIPKSADEFTKVYTENPESQGITGTCWCFSTTSFYESEIYRLTKQKIALSELFTVYWQYVEKARYFVNARGKSEFGEGSQTNAVQLMMKKYGLVPHSAYSGVKIGQKFHDHSKMYDEMNAYLQGVKASNAWNEETVVATIKSILNYYIGVPPTTVTIDGKTMTPQEYLKNVTKLNPDDYVDFMSFVEKPYWTKAEYEVPDNWWHSNDYHNVPLNEFMSIIKSASKNGFSISIGGDVSESGINSTLGVAMVPTYDIPSEYIDEYARQFRFYNKSTTDDHAMHLVGYTEKSNGTWFLLKDSGSSGHNNKNSPGYYFYHEDYVKLKMTTMTLHKDAAKDILLKFAGK
ncbi:MAG: peptidase C1 [Bacteroidetes bacterium]|nr:peptidase C1 [Bacteroidota bacterium]